MTSHQDISIHRDVYRGVRLTKCGDYSNIPPSSQTNNIDMGDIAKLLSLLGQAAVARYEEECRQTKTTLPVVHAATEDQISNLSEDFAKHVTSPSKSGKPNPNKRKRDKKQNNGGNNRFSSKDGKD